MGKQRIKPNYRRRVLRLPDLDQCKLAVLNRLGSPASRRVYQYAIDQFIAWYCPSPGWPSIASWLFATACVSNPVVRKRNMPAFLCDSIIIWTRVDWYGANSYLDLANYRCSNLRGVCSDVGVSNH